MHPQVTMARGWALIDHLNLRVGQLLSSSFSDDTPMTGEYMRARGMCGLPEGPTIGNIASFITSSSEIAFVRLYLGIRIARARWRYVRVVRDETCVSFHSMAPAKQS